MDAWICVPQTRMFFVISSLHHCPQQLFPPQLGGYSAWPRLAADSLLTNAALRCVRTGLRFDKRALRFSHRVHTEFSFHTENFGRE